MGKVYGKNASGSTQLIIDGDAIDQRLSTLEANWDSISLDCGSTDADCPANTTARVEVNFAKPFSEPPIVVACIASGSGTANAAERYDCQPYSITTSGCSIAIYNNTGSTVNLVANWIAISA